MFSLEVLDKMNAVEAKRLTQEAKRKKNEIAFLLRCAHDTIKAAARQGKFRVTRPLDDLKYHVSTNEWRNVKAELVKEGFRIIGENTVCWSSPCVQAICEEAL